MAEDTPYDLEERLFLFARNVALFCKSLPRSLSNVEYIRQLIKASSSVGANYIEANEHLGTKDFQLRIKISRKEAKESHYWLRLIKDTNEPHVAPLAEPLMNEAIELKKILSAILNNSKGKQSTG